MRNECQEVEGGLSYVRRMVHGRLDILGGELARRQEGGEPADVGELLGRLPDILADHHRSGDAATARPPQAVEVADVPEHLTGELNEILESTELAGLPDLSTEELQTLTHRLVTFEETVSTRRRSLHDAIDALQAEIARRYRDGEASVDSLLD